MVLVSDFHYDLPEELIAQEPIPERDGSRLLHLRRTSPAQESGKKQARLEDCHFRDFPDLLRSDDLVVFNNTRVFPARLYGARVNALSVVPDGSGGRQSHEVKIEVLLTRQVSQNPNEWECLVRPGRKIRVGGRLIFVARDSAASTKSHRSDDFLEAEVISRGSFGERRIRFNPVPNFADLLERIGHVPLPPYMHREDLPGDKERYQTIYARERGSVAAPTAGLHFTPAILSRLKERGIETAEITLHVGLGTFQPVRVQRVEDHSLHREAFAISPDAAGKINRALDSGRRVVAIGTTTVRMLEYSAQGSSNGAVQAGQGEANIFIYPPYNFKVVGAMLTNFHLPESTLLMLTCAFGGAETVLSAYQHAVEQKYRFYSYGDCMFLE
ncbi:MAG: tRNA preQ1(34) S-adenosylmethionine ribosyltransferase-isomerase QueA [Terriglobales bacterium]